MTNISSLLYVLFPLLGEFVGLDNMIIPVLVSMHDWIGRQRDPQ